jgi:hypothetical protein
MNLKSYLILMTSGTVFCWISWFFIIFKISPSGAGAIGIIAFYLSLFLSIVGSFSVIGFLLRRIALKEDDVIFKNVESTFRQSIFLATIVILLLFLQSRKLLSWWNVLILFFFLILVETLFLTSRKQKKQGILNS